MGFQRKINTDRFGQAYQLIGCKENDKGFASGFLELGGKLYKIEPSESQNEKYKYWVKVTKVDQKKKHSSM